MKPRSNQTPIDPAQAQAHPAPLSQWRSVDLIERLEAAEAAELMADALKEEIAFARRTLAPLTLWPLTPTRVFDLHTRGPNLVRVRRVLDFIAPSDRILDIGTNYGYLSGVLLRDAGLSYYYGMDLAEHQLESVRQMIAYNHLEKVETHLEVRNLYDLDQAVIDAHEPTLIVLLEVLEHVPNAEQALTQIGELMTEDMEILLSVPLFGRLEGCWGHRALFDHARIQRLCGTAGLFVHHIEPLHNTWALVLASPSARRSSRARSAESRPWPAAAAPAPRSYDLTTVDLSRHDLLESSPWTRRLADRNVDQEQSTIVCTGTAADSSEQGHYLGIRFGVPGLSLLRLELSFINAENIAGVFVDACDSTGDRLRRWAWEEGNQPQPLPGDRITCVVKPGSAIGLLALRSGSRSGRASHVDLFVRLKDGAEGGFTLHRAAYAA